MKSGIEEHVGYKEVCGCSYHTRALCMQAMCALSQSDGIILALAVVTTTRGLEFTCCITSASNKSLTRKSVLILHDLTSQVLDLFVVRLRRAVWAVVNIDAKPWSSSSTRNEEAAIAIMWLCEALNVLGTFVLAQLSRCNMIFSLYTASRNPRRVNPGC